jgi:uncharacterized protein YndB with AHSA1/START domain
MGSKGTFDPRPGGIYRLEMNEGWIALGEFVEVDPPRRVVFTWGWEARITSRRPARARWRST